MSSTQCQQVTVDSGVPRGTQLGTISPKSIIQGCLFPPPRNPGPVQALGSSLVTDLAQHLLTVTGKHGANCVRQALQRPEGLSGAWAPVLAHDGCTVALDLPISNSLTQERKGPFLQGLMLRHGLAVTAAFLLPIPVAYRNPTPPLPSHNVRLDVSPLPSISWLPC